jgi:hypothetical protein
MLRQWFAKWWLWFEFFVEHHWGPIFLIFLVISWVLLVIVATVFWKILCLLNHLL